MDTAAALDHARQISREMVWLGHSTRKVMTQYLTAYQGYLNQGVEGTFIQLLASRSLIDASLRATLEEQFPFDQSLVRQHERDEASGSTTVVLKSLDLKHGAPSTNLASPNPALARYWLECEPLRPVPLTKGAILSLGRGQTCDLVLPHQGVSRVHAEIRMSEEDELVLEDGSAFGTFVNGEKVHRATQSLEYGDVIAIGPYVLIVRDEDPTHACSDTLPFRIPGFAAESMHGKLTEVSLSEVLQQIEFNEKSGTLRIIGPQNHGLVAFKAGRPLWAQLGAHRDTDAVFEMIRLEEGEFSFMSAIEPGEQTIHSSVTAMLMDVSRRLDEG